VGRPRVDHVIAEALPCISYVGKVRKQTAERRQKSSDCALLGLEPAKKKRKVKLERHDETNKKNWL